MTGAEGEGVCVLARARVCARGVRLGGETAGAREEAQLARSLRRSALCVSPPSLFPGTQTSGVVTCEEA